MTNENEKPPDNNMEYTMTHLSPDMAQVGLDIRSPQNKRQRTVSDTGVVSETNNVLNAADENVLPTVNSSAVCCGCDAQVNDIVANIITSR